MPEDAALRDGEGASIGSGLKKKVWCRLLGRGAQPALGCRTLTAAVFRLKQARPSFSAILAAPKTQNWPIDKLVEAAVRSAVIRPAAKREAKRTKIFRTHTGRQFGFTAHCCLCRFRRFPNMEVCRNTDKSCALVTSSVRPAGILVWQRAPVAEAEVRAAAVPDALLAAGVAVASGAVAVVPVAPWE